MMIDTSLDAWAELKKTLGPRQQKVYNGLRVYQPCTATELAKALGLSTNSTAPRVKELSDKGMVVRVERRMCTVTGGSAWTWRAVSK